MENFTIKMKEAIRQVTEKWLKNNENLEAIIFDKLDRQRDSMVAKLIGFNSDWHDGWRLDGCNARDRESVVGQLVDRIGRGAIEKWILDQFPKLEDKIKLPKGALNSMLNRIKETYARELHERLYKRAKDLAAIQAEKMIPDLESSVVTVITDSMLELLEPTQENFMVIFRAIQHYYDNGKKVEIFISEKKLEKWIFSITNEVNPKDIEQLMEMYRKIESRHEDERRGGFSNHLHQ